MTEVRIVKYVHVAQPSFVITFSVFNSERRSGTSLEAIVLAADVDGKTEKEIADVAWEQVRAKADEFLRTSTPANALVNAEYTPPTPWP